MVEAQIRARIEELVAEEHSLLNHHSDAGLDAEAPAPRPTQAMNRSSACGRASGF